VTARAEVTQGRWARTKGAGLPCWAAWRAAILAWLLSRLEDPFESWCAGGTDWELATAPCRASSAQVGAAAAHAMT